MNALCQGTASAVPNAAANIVGFSPCGTSVSAAAGFMRVLEAIS